MTLFILTLLTSLTIQASLMGSAPVRDIADVLNVIKEGDFEDVDIEEVITEEDVINWPKESEVKELFFVTFYKKLNDPSIKVKDIGAADIGKAVNIIIEKNLSDSYYRHKDNMDLACFERPMEDEVCKALAEQFENVSNALAGVDPQDIVGNAEEELGINLNPPKPNGDIGALGVNVFDGERETPKAKLKSIDEVVLCRVRQQSELPLDKAFFSSSLETLREILMLGTSDHKDHVAVYCTLMEYYETIDDYDSIIDFVLLYAPEPNVGEVMCES